MNKISLWAGLLLGFGLCAFFLVRLDWVAFWGHLKTLQAWPLPIMFLTVTLSCLGRAIRWRLLAGGANLSLFVVWQSVLVGYLGNFIYPARAGEMLRMLYLNKKTNLQTGRVVMSSLLDRVADLLMLVLCGFALVLWGVSSDDSTSLLLSIGAAALAVILVVFLLTRYDGLLRKFINHIFSCFRWRWQGKCLQWCNQALDGLLLLKSPRLLAGSVVFSTFVVIADIFTCWLLLKAFGWELPIVAGMELVVFLGIGACLPAAPGYLGIYQAVSVLVLISYGIPKAGALAFAFRLQCFLLVVFMILGGSAFWNKRNVFIQNRDKVELNG